MCQFKWILRKEIFGVQSTAQVFCFWQPFLTCLPIISLHVSENRHDSTGKALITSSGMLFVLALGASKRLQWCSQWSWQSGLDKCSIQSEKFLSQICASAETLMYFLHSVQSPGGSTCTDICSDYCHEVSSVRAKHLPKACLKALMTNSSELVAAAVAGHLTLWREGLILNVLIYFLNAGEWPYLTEVLNQTSCLPSHSILLTVCFSLQVQTSLLWQSFLASAIRYIK